MFHQIQGGKKCIILLFPSFFLCASAVQPHDFLRRALVLWHFGVILRVNVPAQADGQDHPQQLQTQHTSIKTRHVSSNISYIFKHFINLFKNILYLQIFHISSNILYLQIFHVSIWSILKNDIINQSNTISWSEYLYFYSYFIYFKFFIIIYYIFYYFSLSDLFLSLCCCNTYISSLGINKELLHFILIYHLCAVATFYNLL